MIGVFVECISWVSSIFVISKLNNFQQIFKALSVFSKVLHLLDIQNVQNN